MKTNARQNRTVLERNELEAPKMSIHMNGKSVLDFTDLPKQLLEQPSRFKAEWSLLMFVSSVHSIMPIN